MERIKVEIKFLDEILGTSPANTDIYDEYIASKAPNAESRKEEIATIGVEAAIEKSMTVFPKIDGVPFIWDYQIRGFFKDACGMLRNVKGTESSKIKAYKKTIDGLIFVEERKIPYIFEGPIGKIQRPLRAQTMQGERIALASSETVPAGAKITFTIDLLRYEDKPLIVEWLNYGRLRGIGQWRNSGKGRFVWREIPIS